jgi:hypothetical protein
MHINRTRLSELSLVMFAIRRSGRFRRRMSSTPWAFCARWGMRVGADAFVLVTDQHSPFRLRS